MPASGPSDHPGMTSHREKEQGGGPLMQFDTKIAVVIRTDLEPWQKLNVASFLAGGIAAAFPECIGEPLWRRLGHEISVADRPADPDLRRRAGRAVPRAGARARPQRHARRSIPRTCSRPRMTPPTARWCAP